MTRLEKLQQFLISDPNDSFTHYAIGLEYRSIKDYTNAIATLERLRTSDPNYVATYYQLADCYHNFGNDDAARKCYQDGMKVAKAIGDTHTLSELQAALDELDDQ